MTKPLLTIVSMIEPCHWCDVAIDLGKKSGYEVNVSRLPISALKVLYGDDITVPQIYIGEQLIGSLCDFEAHLNKQLPQLTGPDQGCGPNGCQRPKAHQCDKPIHEATVITTADFDCPYSHEAMGLLKPLSCNLKLVSKAGRDLRAEGIYDVPVMIVDGKTFSCLDELEQYLGF